MKKVDEYLNQLYKGLNSPEAKESKNEMRMHILELVHELIQEGKDDEEALSLALERFGDQKQLKVGLYSLFSSQKKVANSLFKSGMGALAAASIIAVFLIFIDLKNFSNIDPIIPFSWLFNITNTLFVLSGILLLTAAVLTFTHRKKHIHWQSI